jgi:thiamine biosynthesis lipoprotein
MVAKMTKLIAKHHALGTEIDLTVFREQDVHIFDATFDLIDTFEDLLTVNREHSEVMDINDAAGQHAVSVSPTVYELVKQAVLASREGRGFDVTIGPLVQLWHIGFKDARLPQAAEIQAKMQLTGASEIVLDDDRRSVFLPRVGMQLDLGGIGKGYIADRIRDFWLQNGISSGIINLGGNLMFVGPSQHADARWRVGVQVPFARRNDALGIASITGGSVGTSGIYERFLTVNGKQYHHIIDPVTGYPVQTNLASVTVFSQNSTVGEIWSSWGFYNGVAQTLAMHPEEQEIGLIFTTQDKQIYLSPNLRGQFRVLDSEFTLHE